MFHFILIPEFLKFLVECFPFRKLIISKEIFVPFGSVWKVRGILVGWNAPRPQERDWKVLLKIKGTGREMCILAYP